MAHLKDLIVTGVSRFLGTVQAKLFKGNLEGTASNADKLDNKHATDFVQIIDVPDRTSVNDCTGLVGKTTVYRCVSYNTESILETGFSDIPLDSCMTTQQGLLIVYNFNGSGKIGTDKMWLKQMFISPHSGKTYTRWIENITVSGWEIDAAPVNPNLLMNPDFKINQRGFVSGDTIANAEYSLDRWRCAYSNTNFLKSINITSSGIELVTANGAGNGYFGEFHQGFEYPLAPGYYTMSGKIDGVIRTFTGYLGENTDSVLFDGVFVLYRGSFGIRFGDATKKIEWVKLEVGQAATQFIPPDPATELMRCMRYYINFNRFNKQWVYYCDGIGVSTTTVQSIINLPVPLRYNTLKVVYSGNIRILTYNNSGAVYSKVTSIEIPNAYFNGANSVFVYFHANSVIPGAYYQITNENDYAVLAIDAEMT